LTKAFLADTGKIFYGRASVGLSGGKPSISAGVSIKF
jgi:hypothetical protein